MDVYQAAQPCSQGLSSLPPLVEEGREERPWERGCQAAKRQGKYPTQATYTEVNSCLNIY